MLRRQALRWLRADLLVYARLAERGTPAVRQTLWRRMQHWQKDADLASVRDRDALARLDADERKEWQQLWEEVGRLLRTAEVGK